MDDEKSEVDFRSSSGGRQAQLEPLGGQESIPGPSLEGAQSEWRERRCRSEEGQIVDLPECAIPDTGQAVEAEVQRERSCEETFRRDLERVESLTEHAMPPPVDRVSSWRGDWAALESAESRVTAPPPSVGEVVGIEAKLSEYATLFYTISYLVFFSILGALARIGMQWLTFYPGAPLTTGVTWANVGGCILMGFLAEDRKLFRDEWGQWKRKHPRHQSHTSNGPPSLPTSASHLPHPMRQLRRRHLHLPDHHHHQQQNPERQPQEPRNQEQNVQKDEPITPPLEPAQSLQIHKAVKKTIPLYIGLTTGFCGSFTSFSTFMLDAFLALSNDLPNLGRQSPPLPRNGGYSFMAVLAIIIYTLSLSLGALILGCWLGAIALAIWPPDRSLGAHEHWRGRAVFAITFAPLGCLLRFYVSLLLNARIHRFPLGTFAVNILGTLVLAMCYDLQRTPQVVALPPSSFASSSAAIAAGAVSVSQLTGCQVLQGIMDGFCGCTTTVSTWVAEIDSLEHEHAYVYGLITLAVALGIVVVVIGSMKWTVGFGLAVC
ncbi:hypothetical protein ACJ72_03428 [Emergomyces africanus]|uniref:Chromosome condensation protein n=1 Tax=Emergomyces africanus TaxID=1955775 RepID=A0A1B7NZL8_9EURO|nr:hypothetical protein ACJ72_03428 [Emergomyces africanus]